MQPNGPFRAPDLEARVVSLREERAAIAKSLADAQAELRRLRPWSIKRFLIGLSWPFVLIALLKIAQALLNLVR